MPAPKYLFTFEPRGAAKVLNDGEEDRFFAVYGRNYKQALGKILKMGLPNIGGEDDLVLASVQEEFDSGEDEPVKQSET